MKNYQKGSVLVVVIVVAVSIIAVLGILYFTVISNLNNARERGTIERENLQNSAVKNTTPVLAVQAVPSGWKKYNDDKYGFSVAYPPNWTLKADPTGGVKLSAPQERLDGQYGEILVDSIWSLIIGRDDQGSMDSLSEDIKARSNSSVSGIMSVSDTKNTSASYRSTITFVSKNRYNTISENWYAQGNSDSLQPVTKNNGINILKQITSSVVFR